MSSFLASSHIVKLPLISLSVILIIHKQMRTTELKTDYLYYSRSCYILNKREIQCNTFRASTNKGKRGKMDHHMHQEFSIQMPIPNVGSQEHAMVRRQEEKTTLFLSFEMISCSNV